MAAERHPLIGAVLWMADEDKLVLSGRISLHGQPWLADHAVAGTVLLPAAAFVDLAIRAGDHTGLDQLDELTLEAPLVLAGRGGVQLQVVVDAPDTEGRRALSVHSRPEPEAVDAPPSPWVLHATGVLGRAQARTAVPDAAAWPPSGAEPVDLSAVYDTLAERGFQYGPTFQGLRALWRAGKEMFAEVALPKDVAPGEFGIHPALLDATLHPLALAEDGRLVLPFAWTGVRLHATNASVLRVRLTPNGSGTTLVPRRRERCTDRDGEVAQPANCRPCAAGRRVHCGPTAARGGVDGRPGGPRDHTMGRARRVRPRSACPVGDLLGPFQHRWNSAVRRGPVPRRGRPPCHGAPRFAAGAGMACERAVRRRAAGLRDPRRDHRQHGGRPRLGSRLGAGAYRDGREPRSVRPGGRGEGEPLSGRAGPCAGGTGSSK